MTVANEKEMAAALLAGTGRFAVCAHLRPDGDAVGSAVGLCRALRAAGREAFTLALRPVSEIYSYLDAEECAGPEPEDFSPAPGDTLVVLDCGSESRIPEALRALPAKMRTLCIDHHESNNGIPGATCLVEPDAASASEIVLRVVRLAGLPVDRAAAEAFWTGVVTDSGRFSYGSTSRETLLAGADLVSAGVRTEAIAESVYGRVPMRRIKLQRRFLEHLAEDAGGKVVSGWLDAGDYAAEGCDTTDSENFVDIPRAAYGCEIAAFVRRSSPGGKVNVSLRARPPFDAAAICAEWGGGGHGAAAGATLDTDLETALLAVRRRLCEAVGGPPPQTERDFSAPKW